MASALGPDPYNSENNDREDRPRGCFRWKKDFYFNAYTKIPRDPQGIPVCMLKTAVDEFTYNISIFMDDSCETMTKPPNNYFKNESVTRPIGACTTNVFNSPVVFA